MVTFNQIPSDIRASGLYVEINAGRGPAGLATNRLLLIGQKLAGGVAGAGVAERVDDTAIYQRYGDGSMLAEMCAHARRQAPALEIWALPLADASGSAAATATVTFVTTVFPLGRPAQLDIYVAGERIRVPVLSADTEQTVAANFAAAVNAGVMRGRRRVKLPVSAAVGSTGSEHIVTLTSRNKGAVCNSLDVSVCHAEDDDQTAKTAVTIVNFASGSGAIDLAAALATLGDEPFDTIAAPYSDSTSVDDAHDFLEARWGWDQQIYGHYWTWNFDSYSNLGTYGALRNSPYVTVGGTKKLATPLWGAVAALGADMAVNMGGGNRNRPVQGIVLQGVKAKARGDQFTLAERNSLLHDGISTFEFQIDRTVMLERMITTYQTSEEGVEDISWLDVNTRYINVFVARFVRAHLRGRYARATLDEDRDRTRQSVRADLIDAYRKLINRGVVDNIDGFRARLSVAYNADDPSRLDIYFPVDVQNQLQVIGVNQTSFLRFAYA